MSWLLLSLCLFLIFLFSVLKILTCLVGCVDHSTCTLPDPQGVREENQMSNVTHQAPGRIRSVMFGGTGVVEEDGFSDGASSGSEGGYKGGVGGGKKAKRKKRKRKVRKDTKDNGGEDSSEEGSSDGEEGEEEESAFGCLGGEESEGKCDVQ